MARTRGWLLPLVAAPLVLVLAAVVAGFVFPSHVVSQVVAVDMRTTGATAEQALKVINDQPVGGAPVVVVADGRDRRLPPCTKTCEILPATTETAQQALEAHYRADVGLAFYPGMTNAWTATVTVTSFNVLAAVVTAFLFAVVAAGVAVAWLRARGTGPPARVSPPPRYVAPQLVRTVSHPPADPGPGQAIARSHVSAAGGYVELGEIVVWAVLSPHARTVAAPGDLLDVLETDQKNAVLTVAPALAAAQRGSTP
jgi:hypothetical protein